MALHAFPPAFHVSRLPGIDLDTQGRIYVANQGLDWVCGRGGASTPAAPQVALASAI